MSAPPQIASQLAVPVSSLEQERRRDFGDWLSPILVKELRQALRSRVFITLFLVLQVALVYFVMQNSTAESFAGSNTYTALFWTLVGLVLLIFVPVMSVNAVASEFGGSRLELLTLSRLSARGIVRGKWLASFGQALLLAITLFPYLIIRYYIGSVDLVRELQILALMLLACGMLTAGALVLSTIRGRILRTVAVVFVLVPSLLGLLGGAIDASQSSVSLTDDTGGFLPLLAICVFYAVTGILLLWEIAASQFAPAAENHETTKRLLCTAMVVVSTILYLSRFYDGFAYSIGFIALAVTTLDATLRSPVFLPTLYRPFVRRGLFGRWIGRLLLYPGYVTGLIFAVLAWTGYNLVGIVHERSFEWLAPGFIGILSVPLAFRCVTKLRAIEPFWQFILVHAVLLVASGILLSLIHNLADTTTGIVGFFPLTYIFVFGELRFNQENLAIVLSILVALSTVLVVLLTRKGDLGRFRKAEAKALELIAEAQRESATAADGTASKA
ncbi:MAG: ABC transporter permease [Opitutales bacterium]